MRQFVASVVDIDAFETQCLEDAAGASLGTGGGGFPLDPEVLYDAFGRNKSRRGGPADSREALRVCGRNQHAVDLTTMHGGWGGAVEGASLCRRVPSLALLP